MRITENRPGGSTPLVSVVIASYNYGHYLNTAFQSLLDQTWQHWECIVVNDGSTDSTEEVVKRYQEKDSRFKYIHQSNQGPSAARNAGLAACAGLYVQLLDADDGIEPLKLERHTAYLEQHPDVDLVYGDVRYLKDGNLTYAEDISNRRGTPHISGTGDQILDFLIRRNILVINAPLIRISSLREAGNFDVNLRGHEDWEYWLRFALMGKRFAYAGGNGTHALVHVHRGSATQNAIPMLQSNLAVRNMLRVRPLSRALHRQNNFRIGLQLARLAKITLMQAQVRQGLRYAVDAIGSVRRDWRIVIVCAYLLVPHNLANRLVVAVDRGVRTLRLVCRA